ncbi:MAG TPA: tRNA (N(6)-L-threonylcarbamoyladenosine(37)-C(2))-methylthiotransferase MtaB, partial [bacterium]|nr:tRNA (N(6)-L-threonylcarbamoyladenosine(37)-C(2))-methylthiotransferase MtaB [bacterium]
KKTAPGDDVRDFSLETKTKIAFTTLGCRVNQYDTQAMKEQLERADFQTVAFEEPADIYVINTCTVTAAADAEGRQLVRRAKARNPDSFVVVTGCLAQDRPGEVAALSGVDLVVGNNEKSNLLYHILQSNPAATSTPSAPTPSHMERSPWGGGISRFDGHQRATIKVQDGCNFGCSFCLIPRVRGVMVSRPGLEIVEEGKRLAQNGVKELVLAGIQLSSYGRDWGRAVEEPRLAPVIEKLLEIKGIQRIRLSSYAVADFEDALLPLWQAGPGLCAHLHLPLQSGDEGILKAMRRPYRLDHYRRTVEKVRKAAPHVGLTSDIIAGFPGETDGAFENTLHRIREFDFVDFHPFPYSDRPDTPGEKIRPKVNPAVIRERMNRLGDLKKECLARSAQRAQGRECRVIVERHNRDQQAGLTDEGLRVFFPRKEGWLGKETRVRMTGAQAGAALAEWV